MSDAIGLFRGHALDIPDRACADETRVRAVKHERTYRKCLHCDRQLPMMRAFLKTPFCTPAHEQEYRVHMEVLMLARLRESELRLKSTMKEASES